MSLFLRLSDLHLVICGQSKVDASTDFQADERFNVLLILSQSDELGAIAQMQPTKLMDAFLPSP